MILFLHPLDLNGDGYVDRDEFNQVLQNKSDILHERQIKFFKKILTKDDGDKVSYQRQYIIFMSNRQSIFIFVYLEFVDGAMQHYRNYVANRDG